VSGPVYVSGTGIDPGWHGQYRANRAASLGPDGRRRFEDLRERIARSAGEERAEAERAYSLLYRSTDLADPRRAARVERTLDVGGPRPNQEVNRVLGADTAAVLEDSAIRPRIAHFAMPALLVHGEADPRPLASVRQLADLLPNARLCVIMAR
jgi:proline iminopeptidase